MSTKIEKRVLFYYLFEKVIVKSRMRQNNLSIYNSAS